MSTALGEIRLIVIPFGTKGSEARSFISATKRVHCGYTHILGGRLTLHRPPVVYHKMYRRIATLNPILERKHQARQKQIYRERMKKVTKSVDNEVPYSYRNLQKGNHRRNLKKEQMQEERYTLIERENRMLLEKMSWIMQHNSIDMHNKSRQFCKSLNYPHRVTRLKKINEKNKDLLNRIKKTKPYYDTSKWEQERKVMEHHLEHMGEYPYIMNKLGPDGRVRPETQERLRRRNLRLTRLSTAGSSRRPGTSGSSMSLTTGGRRTPGSRGRSMSRGESRDSLRGNSRGRLRSRNSMGQSRPGTSESMMYRPNTAEGRMSTPGERGGGRNGLLRSVESDGLTGTEPPVEKPKPQPSHEVVLLEEEITKTVAGEHIDMRTTVTEVGMRHPNGSDGCTGLMIRALIPGDEVTVEYICGIEEVKRLCGEESWANAVLDLVEPVNDMDEDEDFGNEVVYKRVSDVAQTLTEGFNAAVALARHVAQHTKLCRDDEGTYYFSGK